MARPSIRIFGWTVLTLLICSVEGRARTPEFLKLRETAHQLFNDGKYRESSAIALQLVQLEQAKHGPRSSQLAPTLNLLAKLYFVQGLPREGKRFAERSLAIRREAFGHSDITTAEPLNLLGLLCHLEGHYVEGEKYAIQSLTIRENALGLDHPDVANTLYTLSLNYGGQGRFIDAERSNKRALVILQKAFGPDHPEVAKVLHARAYFSFWRGDYATSETEYSRALRVREAVLGANHPDLAESLNGLAAVYWQLGKYKKAEDLFKRAISILEAVFGPFHPYLAGTYNNLGGLFYEQARYSEAQAQLERTLSIREEIQGPDHPDLESALSNIALTHSAQGDWLVALTYYQRATDIISRRTKRVRYTLGRPRSGKFQSSASIKRETLVSFISAAHHLASQSKIPIKKYSETTFEAAQWALFSKAAATLAQMSARQATNDVRLAKLARERQDLVTKWQNLDRDLTETRTQLSSRRNSQRKITLQAELYAVDNRIAQIDQWLDSEFKEYIEFANPTPLKVHEVQKLLGSNEALILFLDAADETFIWAVTAQSNRWVRSPLGTKELTQEVSGLRCGLDSAAWQGERALECLDLLHVGFEDAPQHENQLPFGHVRAYGLYWKLFGQIEDLIEGKDLLLVPAGPLTQLPFQVLVTKEPRNKDHKSVAWLVRQHAITVLPSVSSLKALREIAKPSNAPKPFIGFGNPLLDGPDNRSSRRARLAREFQTCSIKAKPRVWQQITKLFGLRHGVKPTTRHGGLAELSHLRIQIPLPETADELCRVAHDIKANTRDVILGARATESLIKEMSNNGSLSQYRIVHFATHGAVAGQLSGTFEPGLILTPPKSATAQDDGYLSATEIADLKLDAEWVILSACNTAAGGADDAEALGGLARAFFYSGARALLVSHWEIVSEAAVELVTRAIRELSSNNSVGRSEAVRRAMLSLINSGSVQASHPSYWAPFIVVGEGS